MFYTLMKRRKELEKVRREAFEKARREAFEKAFHEGFDEGRRQGYETAPKEFYNEGAESSPEGAEGAQGENKPSDPRYFLMARALAAQDWKGRVGTRVFFPPLPLSISNPGLLGASAIDSWHPLADPAGAGIMGIGTPYDMGRQRANQELNAQIYVSLMNKKPFRVEYDLAGNPRFVDIANTESSVV